MDVMKMLDELRSEREAIEEAILTLERLAQGQGRRRGRPPAWLAAIRKGKPVVAAQPPMPVKARVGSKAAPATN